MTALRKIAAAAVALATLGAIYYVCVRPLRWNRAAARAKFQMTQIVSEPNEFRARDRARVVLEETAAFAGPSTHDLRLHFYRAMAWDVLGNSDAAVQELALTLRVDQRPEIYLNLANALAREGRKDDAVVAALMASRHHRNFFQHIADGEVQVRVESALTKPEASCDPAAESANGRRIAR